MGYQPADGDNRPPRARLIELVTRRRTQLRSLEVEAEHKWFTVGRLEDGHDAMRPGPGEEQFQPSPPRQHKAVEAMGDEELWAENLSLMVEIQEAQRSFDTAVKRRDQILRARGLM